MSGYKILATVSLGVTVEKKHPRPSGLYHDHHLHIHKWRASHAVSAWVAKEELIELAVKSVNLLFPWFLLVLLSTVLSSIPGENLNICAGQQLNMLVNYMNVWSPLVADFKIMNLPLVSGLHFVYIMLTAL